MHTIEDLDGASFVRCVVTVDAIILTMISPSGFQEGGQYFPAESFTLTTVEAIERLQNILDRAILRFAEMAGAPLELEDDRPALPLGAFKL